ncbi:MAG: hypothetical protein Q9P44_14425 [Anaerolineae bacterium]|nr:hypothetical protein [Anaerolineae bacterium]
MLQEFIEAMVKHLPPSSSELHLLDIGGVVGEKLSTLRHDLSIEVASLYIPHWSLSANSVDAVLAYDIYLSDDLLSAVQNVMRPGGRFIVVNPMNSVDEQYVTKLENAGYVRILVEAALIPPSGVLIRGEKAHNTDDTLERVEQVATADDDLLNLDTYRGRYIHLLVRQSPNKPAWKLAPDETVQWHATAIEDNGEIRLLAFSSLPKAVNFMQSAVIQDIIRDVNKVGKFSLETARIWTNPVLLNPTLASVRSYTVLQIAIDPTTAELPDE